MTGRHGLPVFRRIGLENAAALRSASWQLVLVCAALAALAALVYGPHVAHGTFVSDDWANADGFRHLPDAGYEGLFKSLLTTLGARPLLAAALPAPYALLGTAEPAWHLAMAAALTVFLSGCAFVFLRAAGLRSGHAAIIAALLLVFPWDSSIHLWPTASLNQITIVFVLLGGCLALRGLRARGWSALAWHAAAVLLYVLSIAMYEVAGVALLLTGLLYAARGGWRAALPRWGVDVACVGAALAWTAMHSVKWRPPLKDQLEYLPHFAKQGIAMVVRSAFPVPLPGMLLPLAALALGAVVLTAVVAARGGDPSDRHIRELRRWLLTAGGALVALAASWVLMEMTVGFAPLRPGLNDRANIAASLPAILLVWSIWMLAVTLAARGRPQLHTAGAVVAGALLLVGYSADTMRKVELWDAAAAEANRVVDAFATLPPLRPETTVYTFGHAARSAPGIPVFVNVWELHGAARLVVRDPSLRAYPVYEGAVLTCGPKGLHTILPAPGNRLDGGVPQRFQGIPHWGPDPGTAYGEAVFLDVGTGAHRVIADAGSCRDAVRTFQPGPMQLADA